MYQTLAELGLPPDTIGNGPAPPTTSTPSNDAPVARCIEAFEALEGENKVLGDEIKVLGDENKMLRSKINQLQSTVDFQQHELAVQQHILAANQHELSEAANKAARLKANNDHLREVLETNQVSTWSYGCTAGGAAAQLQTWSCSLPAPTPCASPGTGTR